MKMNQENKQLYNQFKDEVWLFLDNDLPEERMEFWRLKLNEIPELEEIISDYRSVSEYYENVKEIDVGTDNYNKMIDKAIRKKTIPTKLKIFFENILLGESEFAFGKIAFASVLIIAAVLISVLSNKPNPVINITNTINADLLEWDADFVDDQISRVGTLLKVTQDDEYRKYYKYNVSPKNVDKNLNLINANIESLKKELNNKEL